MANDIKITVRVSDDGTLRLFDQAGREAANFGRVVEGVGARAERGFSRFQAGIVSLNQGLDLARRGAELAGRAIDTFLLTPLAEAERVGKLAKQLGFATEELSALRYAAEVGDASFEQLAQSITYFERKTAEGAAQTQRLMRELRIDSRATPTAQFYQLADAIASIRDPGTRAAVTMELMGRSGRDLIPFMSEGSAAIRDLTEEARTFGKTYDDEFAKAADDFGDDLTRLKEAATGSALSIAKELLPAIKPLVHDLTEWAKANREIIANDVTWSIRGIVTAATAAMPVVGALVAEMRALEAIRNRNHLPADAGPVTARPAHGGESIDDFAADVRARPALSTIDENAVRNALRSGDPSKAAKEEAKKLNDELQRSEAELNALIEARNTYLDAELIRRQNAADSAERALDIATQTGATEEQQLALATEIDARNVDILEAKSRALDATIEAANQQRALLVDSLAQTADEKTKLDIKAQIAEIDAEQPALVDRVRAEQEGIAAAVQETQRHGAAWTRELEQQQRQASVVSDVFRDILTRARDFSGGDFFAGITDRLQDQLFTDVTDAFLSPTGTFADNFEQTFSGQIVGTVKSAVDKISDLWSVGMDGLSASSEGTARGVGDNFGRLADRLSGMFRTSPDQGGLAGTGQWGSFAAGQLGEGAAAAGSSGGSWGGFAASALGESAGAAGAAGGATSTAGVAGIGAGIAGAAAVAGPVAGAVLFAKGVSDVISGFKHSNEKQALQGSLYATAAVPIIGQFIAIGTALAAAFGAFKGPTGGTKAKGQLHWLIGEAGLPEQRVFNTGGQSGVRSNDIERFIDREQVARARAMGFTKSEAGASLEDEHDQFIPTLRAGSAETDELRFNEGLGFFNVFNPNERLALNQTNAFTNSLLAMNVSVEEGRRQLLALADAAGIDAANSIQLLQKRYIEGDINQGVFINSLSGAIKLFNADLPAGVDTSAIALRNFTEQGGVDIALFNKDLEETVKLYGGIQSALEGGLGNAFAGSFEEDGFNFKEGFGNAIYESALGGLRSAFIDATKETAPFKAISASIGGIVEQAMEGNIAAALLGMDALGGNIDAMFTALEPTLEVFAQIEERFQEWRTERAEQEEKVGFRDLQAQTVEDVKAIRFQQVAPVNRLNYLRQQEDEARAKYASATTDVQRREALEEIRAINLQIAEEAGTRFAEGTRQQREALEESVQGLEFVGAEAGRLADLQETHGQIITQNTAAIQLLTDAILEGQISTGQAQRFNDQNLSRNEILQEMIADGTLTPGQAHNYIDAGRFAKGGSFVVPGSGGTDSQRVMMNVTPGETVTVRAPGAGNPVDGKLTAVLERIERKLGDPQNVNMDLTLHGQSAPVMTPHEFRQLLIQAMRDSGVRASVKEASHG